MIYDYRPMSPEEVEHAKDGTEAEFREEVHAINTWLVTRAVHEGRWWYEVDGGVSAAVLARIVHQYECCGWQVDVEITFAGERRLVLRARPC